MLVGNDECKCQKSTETRAHCRMDHHLTKGRCSRVFLRHTEHRNKCNAWITLCRVDGSELLACKLSQAALMLKFLRQLSNADKMVLNSFIAVLGTLIFAGSIFSVEIYLQNDTF